MFDILIFFMKCLTNTIGCVKNAMRYFLLFSLKIKSFFYTPYLAHYNIAACDTLEHSL